MAIVSCCTIAPRRSKRAPLRELKRFSSELEDRVREATRDSKSVICDCNGSRKSSRKLSTQERVSGEHVARATHSDQRSHRLTALMLDRIYAT